MTEILAAAIPFALGWVVYVERRLGKITTIDEKLDLLINYLIPEHNRAKSEHQEGR